MFDWFWEFLYMISKTIYRLVDGLILCANMLCGIEPINFDGEETDFLSYLLFSDEIGFAFRVSAILATILLILFTIFMIIRSLAKDKAEGTPAQLAVKSFKTLLMFFFVPVVMIGFITIGNAFVKALYSATTQAASSPGAFLFSAFAVDGGMSESTADLFMKGTLDYTDTDVVASHMDLSQYSYIFSWLAGGVVLFSIGSSMLIFVDRVISIVILYIAAPFSIASSVLDDGARFKLWRDQFLGKFVMGYGMILAVNIYALICALVMNPDFSFFLHSDFLNLLMKLLMIGGGALTLNKAMALVGNLVSQGAGSNEMRDNAFSAGKLASMAKGGALGALGFTPMGLAARAAKSIASDAVTMKSRDLGAKLLDKVGLGMGGGTEDKDGLKDPSSGRGSGAQNTAAPSYNSGQENTAKNAINNEGFATSNWGGDNANNEASGGGKGNPVSDAVNNSGGVGEKKEGEGK